MCPQAVAFAQPDDPIELEDISIIGTKTERLTDEIPASITVITEDRLDKEIARDISDLVRYEPGISLSEQGRGLDYQVLTSEAFKETEYRF